MKTKPGVSPRALLRVAAERDALGARLREERKLTEKLTKDNARLNDAVQDYLREIRALRQRLGGARQDALEEAAQFVEGVESIPDPRGVADAIRDLKGTPVWVQCSTVTNDCLGGCRTREEHERYARG